MFRCPFCGAVPTEGCHVRGATKPLSWPHSRRLDAYQQHFDSQSPSDGLDRTESRRVDAITTMYGTTIDVIAEGVLREDAQGELRRLMDRLKPGDFTAYEILGVLAIFRGARERLDAQQRRPAPVLQLIPT
jgi:hypothetical protein